MKYFFLILLIFFVTDSLSQQRSIISGQLVDSISDYPINNFTLSYTDNKSHERYISYLVDKNGNFISEDIKFKMSKIKISSLGFESIYYSLNDHKFIDTIKLNKIYMKRKIIDLKEVIVKSKNTNIELDTIKYNFKDSTFNRSIFTKDVLLMLPNFKIVGGKIFYNNLEIGNLLVNGQKFFFNDQAFTLNNLPAFSIDHIELIKADERKKNYLTSPVSVNIIMKKNSRHGILSSSLLSHTLNKNWSENLLLGLLSRDKQLSATYQINNINTKTPNVLDYDSYYGENREKNANIIYSRKIGNVVFGFDFQNNVDTKIFDQEISRIDYFENNTLATNYSNSNTTNSILNKMISSVKYSGKASNFEFSQNLSNNSVAVKNNLDQKKNIDVLKFIQVNKNNTNNFNNNLKYSYRDIKNQNLLLNIILSQNTEKTQNDQIRNEEPDNTREFLNNQLYFKSEFTYLFNQNFFFVFNLTQNLNLLKFNNVIQHSSDLDFEEIYNQKYGSTGIKLYKLWNKFQFDINLVLFNFDQKSETDEIRDLYFLPNIKLNYSLSDKFKVGVNYGEEVMPVTLSQSSSFLYNTNEIGRGLNFMIVPENNRVVELTFEKSGMNKIVGNIGYYNTNNITDDVLNNINYPEIVFSNVGKQKKIYLTIRQETVLLKKIFFSNYFNYNFGKRLGDNLNVSDFTNILKELSTTISFSKKEWNYSIIGNYSTTKRINNGLDPNKFKNFNVLIKGTHPLWYASKLSIVSNYISNKSIGVIPSSQKLWLTNLILEQTLLKNKNISCFFRIQDLLNKTKNYNNQTLTGNSLQISSISGIGRYFLLGFTYRFNTLKNR